MLSLGIIQRLRHAFGPDLPVRGTCPHILVADQDQTDMEALLDLVLPNGENLDQEMTDQQLAEATHEELNQPAAAQTDSQTQTPPLDTSALAF